METQILKANDPSLDCKNIAEAAEVLRGGGLVAFPTETVYGLGANALDEKAVAGIFRAKGRPADNPLIVHVTTPEEIAPLTLDFPAEARRLAEAFWPGPLTIILPKSGKVPGITSGGLSTVAIRMPSHPIARALIRMAGVPVAAPSANASGSPSPTNARHCIADMSGKADIILDGGECEVGVESTVLTLAEAKPRLLRPGAVTAAMLREVLGEVEIDKAVLSQIGEGQAAISPGMKYKHYAPKAEVTIVHGDDEAFYAFAQKHSSDCFLAFDEDKPRLSSGTVFYGSREESLTQAKRIFSALRELDDQNAKTVYARAPFDSGLGLAVYNRLLRAAAFREIYL